MKALGWCASLRGATLPLGLAQNMGKLQLLFDPFDSSKSAWDELLCVLAACGLSGSFKRAATHLGALREMRWGFHGELHQLICSANQSWAPFGLFWRNSGIPLKWRMLVFKSTVYEKLLDGTRLSCTTSVNGASWRRRV